MINEVSDKGTVTLEKQGRARTIDQSLLQFDTDWQYSPAPEDTSHVKIKKRYELFYGGKWRKPKGGKYFQTLNPANLQPICEIADGNDEDVDLAVKAARRAHDNIWSKLPGKERAKYVFRIARMIQERSRELAIAESLDNGKVIRETRTVDVPLAAAYFFYYAGWADKLEYAFPGRNPKSLGVAGQVIPWNFPFLMASWKIAPAIAAGNTVVIKPSKTTPFSILKLAEIIQEADLPPGVVNILTGAGRMGNALVNHPLLNKIAFTGSTGIGRIIHRAATSSITSDNRKKVTLELGGKAANIVFEDAPIDQAVEGVINAIYFNQGCVCCAGSRLFIEESIQDNFLRRLKDRMETLVIGDPLDKNSDIGAINNKPQLDTIHDYIRIGKEEGCDYYESSCPLPKNDGYWVRPGFFTNVSQSCRVAQEEIFGPVLAVQTFRTVDEVVAKANNTPYGLSAGVWTDKGSKIFNLTTKLKAGVVWANTFNRFDPTSPFGGYKESGYGREGGLHGLIPYLKL